MSLRVKPGPNRLAVTGIGNAMLDIISRDSHNVHAQLGLVKASMNLIGEDQLDTFYNAMGPTVEMSGGSVANSIAGVAALGGTCGYIGKVADDDFGERFTHDLRSLGVELDLAIAATPRGRDRSVPRLHHRRRPAHDGDVPRRVATSCASRTSPTG